MSETTPETSLNGVVESLISNEPKVREEIVEALQAAKEPTSETPETPANFVSSDKENPSPIPFANPTSSTTGFDPAIHESNPDGSPRLTVDGKYRKKRGRKAGVSVSGRTEDTGQHGSIPTAIDYRGMGQFFSGLFFSGTTSVFGPAWEPTASEKENLENATTRYCESKAISDLPPGMMLVMTVALYTLPRLNDDETHRRIRSFGEKIGVISPKPKKVESSPVPNQEVSVSPSVPVTANSAANPLSHMIPSTKVSNPLSQFAPGASPIY